MSEIRVDTIVEKTTANGVSVDGVSLKDGGATLSDNLLFNASGKGVYLGVTTATASNLLDDYEEGTWTPTVSNGTVSHSDSVYTKIGRTVFVQTNLENFSDITTDTLLRVSGLPFTSLSTNGTPSAVMFRYINTDNNGHSIVAFVGTNRSTFDLYAVGDNMNWDAINNEDLASSSTKMYISIRYTV